jgi:hypothetical protein
VVIQPSVAVSRRLPDVTRGVDLTNTIASRTTYPRVSVTLTRTVTGPRRLATGFGAKTTCDTIRRWSEGTLEGGIETAPLGNRIAPGGSGTPTTPDSDERTVVEPMAFRAVTLTRSFLLTSLDVSR